ncbi:MULTISPECIES: hypothetical protein [Microbulbifer]|uniref:hypothetical protein n=1 Tax=Microbulbifer TaxID=48073 RepID=UPI001141587A|nr:MULTISPECIES: hypothetical protein [Microbulbifer]
MCKKIIVLIMFISSPAVSSENISPVDTFAKIFGAIDHSSGMMSPSNQTESEPSYFYFFDGSAKAEIRTCFTLDGKQLVRGSTTGGFSPNVDREILVGLEQRMEQFWEAIPYRNIADPSAEGCVPKTS